MYISSSVSLKNCQICSKPSHGNHFGAISCRACAIFFRRAVLKNYSHLKCSGKCKGDICKKCRLEKCLKAGMNEKQFQYDRDLISSTCKNIPPSMEYFLGRPVFIIFCNTEFPKSERSYVDFTKLIEKATDLFKNQETKLYVGMNTLNQLTYALTQNVKTVKPSLRRKFGKDEMLAFWETSFLKVADWLSYCDKFQELPMQMRIQILKSIWIPWTKLKKHSMTAKRRKQSQTQDRIRYWSDDCLIDPVKVEFDNSWITTCNPEQLKFFTDPLGHFPKSPLIELLADFQPTNQEVTYMLTVFSFRHSARSFNGEFEKLYEKMIEVLANDLHSYYSNEMKLINYAGRMAQMSQIVNYLERDVRLKFEKTQLARIFNLFIVDFSHPEMFQ